MKLRVIRKPDRNKPPPLQHLDGWSSDAHDLIKKRYLGNSDDSIESWIWKITGAFTSKYPSNEAASWQKAYFNLISSRSFFPTSAALKNCLTTRRSLSGCTVIPLTGAISDLFNRSIPTILNALRDGTGVGLDLTPLAPRLLRDRENDRPSPGPVEVMIAIAHLSNGIMKINGLKRAAFMASLSVEHPDIFEFMVMKRQRDLEVVNISIAIDEAFTSAFRDNGLIEVRWNGAPYVAADLKEAEESAPSRGVPPPDLMLLSDGRVLSRSLGNRVVGKEADGRIYFQASRIIEAAAEGAHACGDPGIINLTAINRDNPTVFDGAAHRPGAARGRISSTTPCGEQPLLPYEVCHLGSFNLSAFLSGDSFDFERFTNAIHIAVRMMDDIIDLSDTGIAESNEASHNNRKMGLGIMGLADVLACLSLPYDSEDARDFAEKVARCLNDEAVKASEALAKERGPYPNWIGSAHQVRGMPPRRNATVSTIAPTGHISILAGCSTGIEPFFSLHYTRDAAGNRIVQCAALHNQLQSLNYSLEDWILATKRENPDYSFNGTLHGLIDAPTGDHRIDRKLQQLKRVFITAHQISARDHLLMLSALQRNIENGISKTINLAHEATVSEVYQIFTEAIRLSLKGITVFRDGSLSEQALRTSRGCSSCGALIALTRNECGGYICALDKGGCGYAVCEA